MAKAASTLALRFISGKHQGEVLPLPSNRELRIGRQSDLEIVLNEEMVSRRHARITTSRGEILIEDLGSTNGTFVNGRKVQQSALREGDRVLVGTSLFRVVRLGDGSSTDESQGEGRGRRTSMSGRFSGNLADVPLPDLLQLLSTGKKTGALKVDGLVAGGTVHLRSGNIIAADLDGLDQVPSRKALFRMLGWAEGGFELHEPVPDLPEELDQPTEALLLDAMREIDELRRIAETLPAETENLLLRRPLKGTLRQLSPEELDVLTVAHNVGQVGSIIDQTPLTDYESWRNVASLLERGYLVVEK